MLQEVDDPNEEVGDEKEDDTPPIPPQPPFPYKKVFIGAMVSYLKKL
jgi:hypothetical protein